MRKVIYTFLLLSCVTQFACKRSPYSRPVQYVAYVGFNYLDAAKSAGNNHLDSLNIVALQTYLDRD